MLLFNYNDLTWQRCLVWIVSGILFGLWTIWSSKKSERQNMKLLLALDDFDFEGKAQHIDWMNHIRFCGVIAVNGYGFLLEERLIFVEQKKRWMGDRFDILFSDVVHISDSKFLGIFNTGLKITLKSGKTELFVLDKRGAFYKALMSREIN